MINERCLGGFLCELVLLTVCFSVPLFAAKPIPLLAGGNNHICVTDGLNGSGVWCSGVKGASPTEAVPPEIANVLALSSGAWHACAVYRDEETAQNKVRCWGDNRFKQLTLPQAREGDVPIDVVSGPFSNCVLFKNINLKINRVACDGAPTSKTNSVPDTVTHPSFIGAFEDYMCAADSDIVKNFIRVDCWGARGQITTQFDTMFGQSHMPFCSWQESDISCVRQAPYKDVRPKDGRRPYQFHAFVRRSMAGETCTLRDFSISCTHRNLPETAPILQFEVQADVTYDLAMTAYGVCVIHGEGLSCFDKLSDPLKPLTLSKAFELSGQSIGSTFVLKSPTDIRRILQDLAMRTYSFDAKLLLAMQKVIQPLNDTEALAVVHSIGPYLSALDYNSISEQETQQLAQSLINFRKDPAPGDEKKPAIDAKLKVLMAALTTAKPVLLRTHDVDSGVVQVQEAEQLVAIIAQSLATKVALTDVEKKRIQTFADLIAINSYVGNRSAMIHAIISEL